MNMILNLPTQTVQYLTQRATSRGVSVENYTISLLDYIASMKQPSSILSILSCMEEDFKQSGMTEEELDDLIEEVRQEVWDEQQAKANTP